MLGLRSLFDKKATQELEARIDADLLLKYQEELTLLPESVEFDIIEERNECERRMAKEAQDSTLRIEKIKANGDIRKRALEYEINCLKIKTGVYTYE